MTTIDANILAEADRCLGCSNAQCSLHCPLGNNIPAMLKQLASGDGRGAFDILSATNRLGAICGTVCPHRHLCQGHCVLGDKHIDIGSLEQYISVHFAHVDIVDHELVRHNIAVVGGGVSGIACALELCRHGAHVDIYECRTLGGIVADTLPQFRLPKKNVDSVMHLVDKSDISVVQCTVGVDITLTELDSRYSAVYLSVGHTVDNKLNIAGQDKCGVLYGNSYLSQPIQLGDVVVIGGGNVAVDCARTAVRMGSSVTIAYRRTIPQMPAYSTEIEHALQEGVKISTLLSPVEILGGDKVQGIRMQCMQLSTQDQDGRLGIVPTDNYVELNASNIIVATGSSMSSNVLLGTQIEYNRHGVVVDNNMHTGVGNIYAGGDIVNRHGTVVHAVGDGARASASIINMLKRKEK